MEQEESLSSGLEKQLGKFKDVQLTFDNFVEDLARLKAQCDALKSQRLALVNECAQRSEARTGLENEVAKLRAERDSLQIEYAHLQDEDRFWRQYDMSASAELDRHGKVARQLWVQTEKVRELELRMNEMRNDHAREIDVEREVAAGLRKRIGTLEFKMREEGARADAALSRQAELVREAVQTAAATRIDHSILKRDNADAREAIVKTEAEKLDALARADRLEEELDLARQTLQQHKTLAAFKSPPRALQSRSANITTPAPRTPTKPTSTYTTVQPTLTHVIVPPSNSTVSPSQHDKTTSQPCTGTPTSGIVKRYAYLEDRHRALKIEYDRLRAKYTADVQHWTEYKAVEVARRQLKLKKKEEKMASRGATAAKLDEAATQLPVDTADAPSPSKRLRLSSPAMGDTVVNGLDAVEDEGVPTAEDDDIPVDPRDAPLLPPNPTGATTHDIGPVATVSVKPVDFAAMATLTPMRTQASGRSAQTSRQLSHQPTRITPWLGASNTKPSNNTPSTVLGRKHSRRMSNSFGDSDDECGDGSHAKMPGSVLGHSPASSVKTPLIRDRTGTAAPMSSLRRTALERTTGLVPGALDNLDSSSSICSPELKRKLDLEGLCPAERAKELKKISKMSATERRELYAPYKGNGRYVAPQDVLPGVMDEYEIDPDKNDGVKHQYHDVVRNKDQRKAMHGGDCECCRDYYEAVGPIPRFNVAPAWKDDPGQTTATSTIDSNEPGAAGAQADVEDHQNRVSRHRETWRKPPTPPDFWKIGFPNTQDVLAQNATADKMVREREDQIRREAAHKSSKWRKKT